MPWHVGRNYINQIERQTLYRIALAQPPRCEFSQAMHLEAGTAVKGVALGEGDNFCHCDLSGNCLQFTELSFATATGD